MHILKQEEIILTRTVALIELTAAVIPQEEFDDESTLGYVCIKRIGLGLTEDDFEIDLSEFQGFEFVLETATSRRESMRQPSFYLVFNNPPFVMIDDSAEEIEDPLELLKKRRQEALDNQEFMIAKDFDDKINELENKKE